MKKIRKYKFYMFCMILIISLLPLNGYALEVPDADRTGSISVSLTEDAAGNQLSAYRVCEIKEDDGNYSFAYTKEWADCVWPLDELESAQFCEYLLGYVSEHSQLPSEKVVIDNNGYGAFLNMQTGLYLVVQSGGPGKSIISPFVISIPKSKGETWNYDVDASPKTELSTMPDSPPPPEPPIIHTGQLNWPIPLFAISGLLCFALGWYLCFGRRGFGDEE